MEETVINDMSLRIINILLIFIVDKESYKNYKNKRN